MVCGGWSGPPTLHPIACRYEFGAPLPTIPRSIGHRPEWIQACKDHKPEDAKAGFAYSWPLHRGLARAATSLLRLQKRIEWDAAAMRAPNAPEADALIRKRYRDGFASTLTGRLLSMRLRPSKRI